MSTRAERDKNKTVQDKHQAILSALLKDEDNKYCVDCDAKGPRWASWNLGIFLCIRCAGIHRNLGVHISRVKSVNLDSWTAEQVAVVQEMGNSRARAVYEANLPDHFRRPQTDSSLEAFIRAKYEQKKYIAKDWVPPQPKVQVTLDEPKKEKKKTRPRPISSGVPLSAPQSASAVSRPESKPTSTANGAIPTANAATTNTAKKQPETAAKKPASNIDDLLGLDDPAPASSSSNDLFSDFMGAPAPTSNNAATTPTHQASPQDGTPSSDLPASSSSNDVSSLFSNTDTNAGTSGKSTKESILALYGSSSGQQRFGVPGGIYMTNQQMPMMAGMQQNGMMGNMAGMPAANMGMMGMQGNPAMMQHAGMQQQPGGGMMMNAGGMTGMQGGAAAPGNAAGQMAAGMPGMMMQGNMYNMNMNNMQFNQMAQMQNQMAGMNMGGTTMPGSMAGYGQQGNTMNGWVAAPTGQTLSTNLWQ